jgi:hypothetical protein
MAKTAAVAEPAAEPKLSRWQEVEAAIRRIKDGSTDEADYDIAAAAGVTGDRLNEEIHRIQMVDHHRERVASLETLRRTEDAHKAATEARESERKQLEAELAEVQARVTGRLNVLASEQRQDDRALQQMQTSRKWLREKAPFFVHKRVDDMRRRFKESDSAKRLREMESRVKSLHGVVDRTLDLEFSRTIEAARPGMLYYIPELRGAPEPHVTIARAWPAMQARFREELAELEPQLAPLQAEYQKGLQEIESQLDYYLTK